MLIKWYGHSCFKIQQESQSVVIDPYVDGSVAGYDDLRLQANIVLCSHMHKDHCGVENVELIESKYDSPFKIDTINRSGNASIIPSSFTSLLIRINILSPTHFRCQNLFVFLYFQVHRQNH